MNVAEELTGVYLRLNGFLLLHNFTHLSTNGGHVKETDIIGIRCPNSRALVNGTELMIDERLFSENLLRKNEVTPIIVEVKGGPEAPIFNLEKIQYISNFFGDFGPHIDLIAVSDNFDTPMRVERDIPHIQIGIDYIKNQVRDLIAQRAEISNKLGSWNLSEGLLQTLIFYER